MSWFRFTRRDCPVCGGVRKDCRQNLSTNLVHCRDADANPVDYVFRRLDAWGFGMWAYQPDAEAWSNQRREEWIRQRQLEREQQQRFIADARARLLTEEQRDKVIRQILAQLTLTQWHREDLHRRGLTDQEIEAGGYRSVKKWQKLSTPVDDRLAGVKLGGRSLLTCESGIICPIRNHKGQFVGWQLRPDNPKNGNKYIWAAGEKKRNPRPTSHLQNGELPLAVYLPKQVLSDEGRGQKAEGRRVDLSGDLTSSTSFSLFPFFCPLPYIFCLRAQRVQWGS